MKALQVVYGEPTNAGPKFVMDDFFLATEVGDPDPNKNFFVARWCYFLESLDGHKWFTPKAAVCWLDRQELGPDGNEYQNSADLTELPPADHDAIGPISVFYSGQRFTILWRLDAIRRRTYQELQTLGFPNLPGANPSVGNGISMLDAFLTGRVGRDLFDRAWHTDARRFLDFTTANEDYLDDRQRVSAYTQRCRPRKPEWGSETPAELFPKIFDGRLPVHGASWGMLTEIPGEMIGPVDFNQLDYFQSVGLDRPGNVVWLITTMEEDEPLTPMTPLNPEEVSAIGTEATRDRIPDIQVLADGPVEKLEKIYEVAVGPILWFQEQVALVDYDSEDVGEQVNQGTAKLIAQVAGSYAVGMAAAKAAGAMTREKLRNAVESQAVKWAQRTIQIAMIERVVDATNWVDVARILAPYVPEVDLEVAQEGVRIDILAPDGENPVQDCEAVLALIGLEELIEECGRKFDEEVAELELVSPALIVPGYISDGGAGWLLERLEEGDSGYIDEPAG